MRNPFVGLRSFHADEGDLFFGRDRDIAVLTNLVLATPVLVLYGTSGTGKSSLLNAGLVPTLDKDPSLLTLIVAVPHTDVGELLHARLSEAGWDGSGGDAGGGLADILQRHFEATGRRVVLVLDQFEERIKRDTGLGGLYDDVARLANTRSEAATVVLSIREDYVMSLEPLLRRVVGLLDASYRVPSLTHPELMKAVTGPLDAVGGEVGLEPGLIEEVLKDLEHEAHSGKGTTGRIEAGFFQLVWHYLWEQDAAGPEGRLTLWTYEEAGRATGILRTYVDRILSGLTPYEAEVLRAAIRYLVLPSGAKVPLTVDDLVGWLRADDFTPTAETLSLVTDSGDKYGFLRASTVQGPAIRLLLTSVLDQLTRSSAALLRRVVRDDREEFELVHDLVGKILQAWRERYSDDLEQARRRLVAEVFGHPDADNPSKGGHTAKTIRDIARAIASCADRISTVETVGEMEEIGASLRKAFGRYMRLSISRYRWVGSALDALTRELERTTQALGAAALEPSSPPETRRRIQRIAWEYGVLRAAASIPVRKLRRPGMLSNSQFTVAAFALALPLALAGAFGAREFIDAFVPVPRVEYVPMMVAFYVLGAALVYTASSKVNEPLPVALLHALFRTEWLRGGQQHPNAVISLLSWWPFHFLLFELASFAGAWLFHAFGWAPTAGFHLIAVIAAIGIGIAYLVASEDV